MRRVMFAKHAIGVQRTRLLTRRAAKAKGYLVPGPEAGQNRRDFAPIRHRRGSAA
jgi:hypothetical protein